MLTYKNITQVKLSKFVRLIFYQVKIINKPKFKSIIVVKQYDFVIISKPEYQIIKLDNNSMH